MLVIVCLRLKGFKCSGWLKVSNVTGIPDRGSSVGVLVVGGVGGVAINNLVFYAQSTSTVTSRRDIVSRPLIILLNVYVVYVQILKTYLKR